MVQAPELTPHLLKLNRQFWDGGREEIPFLPSFALWKITLHTQWIFFLQDNARILVTLLMVGKSLQQEGEIF